MSKQYQPQQPPDTDEVYLDVGQAAQRWHCTAETVRRKIRRGEIKVIRPCKRILIALAEIERVES